MICSTLSGKLAIKHPKINRLVREDGMILLSAGQNRNISYHQGSIDEKGYRRVKIDGKSYRVHRLVAECFIPNPDNKLQVDHINRNRADNRKENLRWVTSKENQENGIRVIGRSPLITTRQCDDKNEYQRQLRKLVKETGNPHVVRDTNQEISKRRA